MTSRGLTYVMHDSMITATVAYVQENAWASQSSQPILIKKEILVYLGKFF